MSKDLSVGMSLEEHFTVGEADSAVNLGSGSLRVFGTPAMIAYVEQTSRTLIEPTLPEAHTSVGTEMKMTHLAPTPIGCDIKVRAVISKINGRMIEFKAQVWDPIELIGEAEHTRVIIEIDRFMTRVNKKTSSNPTS